MSKVNAHIEELRGALQLEPSEERLELVLDQIQAFDAHDDPAHILDAVIPYLRDGLARWAELFADDDLRDRKFDSDDGGSLAQRIVALDEAMKHWEVQKPSHASVQEFMAQPVSSRILGEPDEVFSRVRFEMDYRVVILRTAGRARMKDVRIPPTLIAYLDAMQGRSWRKYDSPYATKIYWSQGMITSTAYLAETFIGNCEYDGPWLSIGDWSDKHDLMVCCDSESKLFGQVHDFHDAHPWLNGEYAGDLEAETFAEYLQLLVNLPES